MQPKYKIQPHHTIIITDDDIKAKYGNAIFKGGDLFFLNPSEDFDYSSIDFMETIIWRQDNINWSSRLNTLELWQVPKTYNLLKSADADTVVGEMLQVRLEYKFVPTPAKKAPTPVLKAHGLVGMIADWITETAYRPQPQLSLGAALTFVGMLKGHKFSTSTGLRTNILVMNIAPTASGKEHPQWCVEKLIPACGLDKHELTEPTGGTALLKGLQEADRVGLWSIDELGRYLGHVANKNSAAWQKEVIDYVMKSFSKANGKLKGKKFSNEKINPQINIIEPHLCVIGASVKEKIVENCTSSDAVDGFLNRWILFESGERPKKNASKQYITEIPEGIVVKVKKIMAADPNAGTVYISPIIKTVKHTSEAFLIMEDYAEKVEMLIATAPHPLNALYGRSCEHVAKLALILCDNEFIREKDVELAIQIVDESNKLIATFTGLIADNEQEKMTLKVLDLIRRRKKILHADLIRNTKYLNVRNRKEILSDLVNSGEVDMVEIGKTFEYSVLLK